jgi:prepilin-type N-terminal cleavage/methylation domain-containing protein
MNKSFRSVSRAGFTLVELLVVMAIIAVLAGLALPAISGAMDNGKRTKATAQINQIRTAINAFQTEYGTFPTYGGTAVTDGTASGDMQWADSASWGKLCAVLNGGRNPKTTAADTTAQADNPRQIVFMEFKVGDLDSNAALKDPTGSGFTYVLYTDSNYNNIIQVAADSGVKSFPSTTFSSTVAVYSKNGNNGKKAALTTW